MEHRWGNRIAVDVRVRISTAGLVGNGTLRNLSVSGAFIETTLPLATMSLVHIRIARGPHGRASPAEASGFVVRKEGHGIGVEWVELAALQPADVAVASWHGNLRQRNGTARHS
jgi:hypothetical protein